MQTGSIVSSCEVIDIKKRTCSKLVQIPPGIFLPEFPREFHARKKQNAEGLTNILQEMTSVGGDLTEMLYVNQAGSTVRASK